MNHLLDTNAVISLLKRHPRLSARLRQHGPAEFGLPSVVAHELFYGAYKSQRRTENLVSQAGEIRALLALAGTPIGPLDVLIAGQAKARELTLITHNTDEFKRVAGVQIEDWEL
ncbi:type II toxin-antitoxin system VapC family toxin [Lichenicoccus sp.]|uniref:type II toxin-antitoxin system VapC family toxin n=1 Tax=Lichenicoccus sp. TaxID=2781899 RepID=UPI003D0B5C37